MSYDVVIVGGAVMGSATAYHLSRLVPDASVLVLERDQTLARSSTMLSDGNVRIQFNLPENVACSQYAFEVLDGFATEMAVDGTTFDVSARHQGNLFLADAAGEESARAGMRRQIEMGCDVSWVDADEIARRWPIFAGSNAVGGTFGPRDGSVDPGAVVRGFRSNAVAAGVEYVEADVAALVRTGDRIAGVRLADGTMVEAPVVVAAAGAWSPALLSAIGVELPVLPVMRNVFVVSTPLEWEGELPSVFLPDGPYLLPEHDGTFLVAWSQSDDPVGFDFSMRRSRFYDLIWPELVRQLPAFDRLEVVRGWPGLYAVNTFDGNAIVGEWPDVRGLYVCTGFSGHGFQQGPAMGRYLAESIGGIDHAIDLARFGPERILRNEPYPEHAGRLI